MISTVLYFIKLSVKTSPAGSLFEDAITSKALSGEEDLNKPAANYQYVPCETA